MQGRDDKETPGCDGEQQLIRGKGKTVNTGGNLGKQGEKIIGKGYKMTKLVTLNIQGLVSRKKCKI